MESITQESEFADEILEIISKYNIVFKSPPPLFFFLFSSYYYCLYMLNLLLLIIISFSLSHPAMKASQFSFMVVILIGAAIAVSTVILFVLQPTDSICIARPWFLSISFTLCEGSIMAKNYRLDKIFNNKKLQTVTIKQTVAWKYILVLCLIDIVALTMWMVAALPAAVDVPDENDDKLAYRTCLSVAGITDTGEIIVNESILWLLIALKALLVAYTSYLAWKIRSIPSMFNEAKYIALCSYNITIMGIFTVGLGLVLNDASEAVLLLRSISILLLVFSSLSFLFFPKFQAFKKDPTLTMEDAFRSMNTKSKFDNKMGGTNHSTGTEEVLSRRIRDCHKQIGSLKVQIDILKRENQQLKKRNSTKRSTSFNRMSGLNLLTIVHPNNQIHSS